MKKDVLPFDRNAEPLHEKLYSVDNDLILLENL
jgi:hypothetical protein